MKKGGSRAALDQGEREVEALRRLGRAGSRGLLGQPLVDDCRVRAVTERATGGRDERPVPAVDRTGDATAAALGGVTRENGVRLSVGRDKMEVGLHKSGGVPPL
jgi:hypothetical protein